MTFSRFLVMPIALFWQVFYSYPSLLMRDKNQNSTGWRGPLWFSSPGSWSERNISHHWVRLAIALSSRVLKTSKDRDLAAFLAPVQHHPSPNEEPLPNLQPELPCEKCSLRPLSAVISSTTTEKRLDVLSLLPFMQCPRRKSAFLAPRRQH